MYLSVSNEGNFYPAEPLTAEPNSSCPLKNIKEHMSSSVSASIMFAFTFNQKQVSYTW